MKEKEGNDYDDSESWDEYDFDLRGKEGLEWGNNERDKGDGIDDNA